MLRSSSCGNDKRIVLLFAILIVLGIVFKPSTLHSENIPAAYRNIPGIKAHQIENAYLCTKYEDIFIINGESFIVTHQTKFYTMDSYGIRETIKPRDIIPPKKVNLVYLSCSKTVEVFPYRSEDKVIICIEVKKTDH